MTEFYMTELLKNIVAVSISGGLLFVILFAAKPFTRRIFSPVWQYYIWFVVLLVFAIPISLKYYVYTEDELASYRTEISFTETARRPVTELAGKITEQYNDTFPKKPMNMDILRSIIFIWALGVIIMLCIKLFNYFKFKKAVYNNSYECSISELPRSVRLRRTNMLSMPLMIGVFRPVIYLPDIDISEEGLKYILKHELVHFRRGDIIYKWTAMLIACIHWFDPFVYLLLKNIDEDCEISCDYIVSKDMTEEEGRAYMNTILNMAEYSVKKPRPLSTHMAGSKKTLMRRFMAIKKGKMSLSSAIMGVAASIILLSGSVYGASIINDSISDIKSGIENRFVTNDIEYFSYGENVLILGTADNKTADMAMLVNCSSGISVLSIPTEADLGGNIDLKYDYFKKDMGTVLGALENKLETHIDKFIVFNINALKEIADRENGIDIFIGEDIYFSDPAAGVNKKFKRGVNRLSGDDIMFMLNFRDPKYGKAETFLNIFSGCLPMLFEKENLSVIDSNMLITDVEGSLAERSDMLKQSCYKRVSLMIMPCETTEPADESKTAYEGYKQQLYSWYDIQPDIEKIRLKLTNIAG